MLRRRKKEEAAAGTGDGAGEAKALAMVLLREPVRLDGAGLAAAWAELWPGAPPLGGFDSAGDGEAWTFDVEGRHGALGVMPVPIPSPELEGPVTTAWMWPGAAEELASSGAHVVAWVSGGESALDAARTLSRLVAATVHATDAQGVYWGAASHLVRADVFVDMAQEWDGDPVMLWVDFRVYREPDGRNGLFTEGMPALGFMDVEIPPSTQSPGDLREMAASIAGYLLEAGPVIGDGDTIGAEEDQRVLVRHAPSAVGREGLVYRLEVP